MKWKPLEENSIDFELELRFPPSEIEPDQVDLTGKPLFVLNMWQGGSKSAFFDVMEVDDAIWEE